MNLPSNNPLFVISNSIGTRFIAYESTPRDSYYYFVKNLSEAKFFDTEEHAEQELEGVNKYRKQFENKWTEKLVIYRVH